MRFCAGRILKTQGVPPYGKHVEEVLNSTVNLDGDAGVLAGIILKDLGLCSNVLRLANSAIYSRSGRPILRVPHAISLVGWETIRSLVNAIHYLEHYAKRSAGLRELMFLSVLTATHGREVASVAGYPKPEDAYICGLFRSLGEVLSACHFPNAYSAVILEMQEAKLSVHDACLKVFGFPWDEVGAEVASRWNMPRKIRACLGAIDSDAESRHLISITNYSHKLTHGLYREGNKFEQVQLHTFTDARGVQMALAPKDLRRIVNHSLEEAQKAFYMLRIPAASLLLENQAERAREILRIMPVLHAEGIKELDEAIMTANRSLRQGEFELTTLIQSLLNALRGAGFQTAIFGLVNEDRSMIRGRLGSGRKAEEELRLFQFSMDESDGQILALQRKVDILIDRGRDNRYDNSAMIQALQPSAFALFPVVVNDLVAGCLYCGITGVAGDLEQARIPLTRARDVISNAIRRFASR